MQAICKYLGRFKSGFIKEPIPHFFNHLLLEIEGHKHSLIPITIPYVTNFFQRSICSNQSNYSLNITTNIVLNLSHANDHISCNAHATHVHNTSMHILIIHIPYSRGISSNKLTMQSPSIQDYM